MIKNKLLFLSFLLLFQSGMLYAEATSVIDTPTVGILDYGSYTLNFRLFSDGGVLTRLDFGVFRIVNLGFGWEVNKVIGTQDASVGPPALYLKIKPYEGGMILPAIVFGYDGQGYFYNNELEEFTQKEKGIFFAAGREMLFPGFKGTLGFNISDFKNNIVRGFANISIDIEEKFVFLVEYDDIHVTPENKLNLGCRFFITDALNVDLAGRDIVASDREAERVVRINYLGKF